MKVNEVSPEVAAKVEPVVPVGGWAARVVAETADEVDLDVGQAEPGVEALGDLEHPDRLAAPVVGVKAASAGPAADQVEREAAGGDLDWWVFRASLESGRFPVPGSGVAVGWVSPESWELDPAFANEAPPQE